MLLSSGRSQARSRRHLPSSAEAQARASRQARPGPAPPPSALPPWAAACRLAGPGPGRGRVVAGRRGREREVGGRAGVGAGRRAASPCPTEPPLSGGQLAPGGRVGACGSLSPRPPSCRGVPPLKRGQVLGSGRPVGMSAGLVVRAERRGGAAGETGSVAQLAREITNWSWGSAWE